jgi:hypothetical protein
MLTRVPEKGTDVPIKNGRLVELGGLEAKSK